jgi:hypothetical protein
LHHPAKTSAKASNDSGHPRTKIITRRSTMPRQGHGSMALAFAVLSGNKGVFANLAARFGACRKTSIKET